MEYRYQIVLSRTSPNYGLLSLEETARQAGVHPELVLRMVDLGLVEPKRQTPVFWFDPSAVKTICRAVRLRNDLGINWLGVGVVTHLLERVEELENELKKIKRELNLD